MPIYNLINFSNSCKILHEYSLIYILNNNIIEHKKQYLNKLIISIDNIKTILINLKQIDLYDIRSLHFILENIYSNLNIYPIFKHFTDDITELMNNKYITCFNEISDTCFHPKYNQITEYLYPHNKLIIFNKLKTILQCFVSNFKNTPIIFDIIMKGDSILFNYNIWTYVNMDSLSNSSSSSESDDDNPF